ncbi:hypothetical protein GHT06_007197 [Daphnia sinensis]|uniref:Uncharacterized protein n=1 Tax=Daphnia sinensis TaxID=1820382 RepID=A0AAD5KT77_9CRUS|nr:hypothetical protein GHT06_006652 [Daphnia sinensis]KAI9549323.1 hypothetical protein GHT06_006622 [Daphnia sinensis]KAI9549397.1 hypothetical protein GHT06_007197 [Daphnia sinensis]
MAKPCCWSMCTNRCKTRPPPGAFAAWARTAGAFWPTRWQTFKSRLRLWASAWCCCTAPWPRCCPPCASHVGADTVFCEDIAAPEEQAQVQALTDAGLTVQNPVAVQPDRTRRLPFAAEDMPQVFTVFRQRIESARLQPLAPLPAPSKLPAPPRDPLANLPGWTEKPFALLQAHTEDDAHPRSNFPYTQAACRGGETSALAHLHRYLTPPWPDRYKQSRNALQGQHTSSHWSPWLATGAVSARRIWAQLQAYEQQHGSNDGTYWLWFELAGVTTSHAAPAARSAALCSAGFVEPAPSPRTFRKTFTLVQRPNGRAHRGRGHARACRHRLHLQPPCARSWPAFWCTTCLATGARVPPGSSRSWWTLMCKATRATGCMSVAGAPTRVWADASTPPNKRKTTTRRAATDRSGWPDNRVHVCHSILG